MALLADEPPLRWLRKISWKHYLFVALSLLMAPQVAHEAAGVSGPPCVNCEWDVGTLKAPVIIETVITPEPREVEKVTGFGNGTCVPYARARSGIMLYGNAATFLERAVPGGYGTSTKAVLGGIIVTSESTGHVAVVEKIEGNRVNISEQNFQGLYIVSERWLDLDSPIIVGYIY